MKIKTIYIIITFLGLFFSCNSNLYSNVIIEGNITRDKGKIQDSVQIKIKYKEFDRFGYYSIGSQNTYSDINGNYKININSKIESFTISFNTNTKDSLILSYGVLDLNKNNYNINFYFDLNRKVKTITEFTNNKNKALASIVW